MNDQIQNSIEQSQTSGQFGGVSKTPFHTHNGVDSPRIKASNLIGNETFAESATWGIGTMVGGILDVTHPSITSTSTGLATRANASGTAFVADLSAGYNSGTTFRFFEGTFSQTWEVFYLIIF